MKSKLKRHLRLKIALLTLVSLLLGFLLGSTLQRDRKDFTASAATTITITSLPYNRVQQAVNYGSPYNIYFNSTFIGSPISVTYHSIESINCRLRNGDNAVRDLNSGDSFVLSEGDFVRFSTTELGGASVTFTFDYDNSTKLATPVVSLDGSLMTWNPIPNAEGYYIYKNGEYLTGTSEPAVNLRLNSTFGDGVYQVQAIADPESTYTDSELSNSVTYSGGYNDVLGTPILSYNRYILSWNFIVYADTFYIYYSFNGQDYELQAVVNSLSYNPSSNGYYYVVAHSFNDDYTNSPPSNIVNISNLTPTPSDNILHGILSACNDFLNLRLFGDNSITIGFLFSLGVTGLMLGIIIRLFFHG